MNDVMNFMQCEQFNLLMLVLSQRQWRMLCTMCNLNFSICKCWCLTKDSEWCYELCAMWTVHFVNVCASNTLNDVMNFGQCERFNLKMLVINPRQGMMWWTMCNVNSSICKCWWLTKDSEWCYKLCAMWTVQFVNVGA